MCFISLIMGVVTYSCTPSKGIIVDMKYYENNKNEKYKYMTIQDCFTYKDNFKYSGEPTGHHISEVRYFGSDSDVKSIYTGDKVLVYVALDTIKQEKYFMVDANTNGDFSDDTLHIFSLKNDYHIQADTIPFSAYVNLHIKGDGVQQDSTIISIYPTSNSPDLELYVFTRNYWKGAFTLDDTEISVTGTSGSFFGRGKDIKSLYMRLPDANESVKRYLVGDTARLFNKRYGISSDSVNRIKLTYIDEYVDSCEINSYIPQLQAMSLDDNSKILLNDHFKNKYVLIDFWGSWCRPCVASLPQLKELYEKVKNRDDVAIIGVAAENKNSLPKLKKIIERDSIKWLNVWDSQSAKSMSSPLYKLKIVSYPTYIILDKDGKIVYNTNYQESKRDDLIDFFTKLID